MIYLNVGDKLTAKKDVTRALRGNLIFARDKEYEITRLGASTIYIKSEAGEEVFSNDGIEKFFYISNKHTDETPEYYNNEKGSIYKFCDDQELNSYEFDIIKRVVRCRRKGNFAEDLKKTKVLIDLYLKEYEQMD